MEIVAFIDRVRKMHETCSLDLSSSNPHNPNMFGLDFTQPIIKTLLGKHHLQYLSDCLHRSMYVRRISKAEIQQFSTYPQVQAGIIIRPELYQIARNNTNIKQYLQLSSKVDRQMPGIERLQQEVQCMVQDFTKRFGTDQKDLGSKKEAYGLPCKFCGQVFDKAQALGGHISKIHSKQSKTSKKEKPEKSSSKCLKSKKIKPKVPRKRKNSQESGKNSAFHLKPIEIVPQESNSHYDQ